MKLNRNTPCHCGSGQKYKRCCLNSDTSSPAQAITEELQQILAMSPDLSLDELNAVLDHKMAAQNAAEQEVFCGLSSEQIYNWLYAPLNELDGVNIHTPDDLSSSPVMSYLALILDNAMANDGKIKLTTKGNLPAKLVKQASELLPRFTIAKYETKVSISEYAGSNEDKFNALHYTRILADITGIVYVRSGHLHIKKQYQTQYVKQGINAFFMPMLATALKDYNWGYLDAFGCGQDLSLFGLFMLWRLTKNESLEAMINDTQNAFPDFVNQLPTTQYHSSQDLCKTLIESRFIERFLQFWGFATIDPRHFIDGEPIARKVELEPLCHETFAFQV